MTYMNKKQFPLFIEENNGMSREQRLTKIGLFLVLTFFSLSVNAQKPNWQNLDLKTDSVFGISTELAYKELLKGKKSVPVIVGVLDGGVDYLHEDLKRVMWINKKEKAGNGVDDDKNGYVDDVYGWNFIGGKEGSIEFENMELTRLVRKAQQRFGSVSAASVPDHEKSDYEKFIQLRQELETKLASAKNNLMGITGFKNVLDGMVKKIGKANPDSAEWNRYQVANQMEGHVKATIQEVLREMDFQQFYESQIEGGYKYYYSQVNYHYNLDYDQRFIVGDNPDDSKERFYGNNDVKGPDAMHGSHVAGIIGADRQNQLGIKGVADNVLLMAVRNTPNGDERDKDVANAIRYATDNGAKVINMSFGKGYSWDKSIVDEAVRYAMNKDVLLVHAAGNDNKNIDEEPNYPNKRYLNGEQANSWITVGASGWLNNEELKASFSNYGKETVDVFAPGRKIHSTTPENKYADEDGTSMAAPVVSGLAALIRSYYPKLSAVQVKEIIMKSVVKVEQEVILGEEGETKRIPFKELCVTGGIVNAYQALQLAATY